MRYFVYLLCYWSIVDLKCCVNYCCTAKWLSYTYIYILFHILFHYDLSEDIEYISKTLLFIHPIYNILPLLIPNSHSFPPLDPFPLATTSLFSISVSLFLFHRYVDLYRILDSTYKWYLSFSFWLTSLSIIISRSIHVAADDIISFDSFKLGFEWGKIC